MSLAVAPEAAPAQTKVSKMCISRHFVHGDAGKMNNCHCFYCLFQSWLMKKCQTHIFYVSCNTYV